MNDLLPSIHITVTIDPTQFLDRISKIAQHNGHAADRVDPKRLDIQYLGDSTHVGLWAQMLIDKSGSHKIACEVRARQWRPGPPTYDAYVLAAKGILRPLLSEYAVRHKRRLRLIVAKKRQHELVLTPRCNDLFRAFLNNANKSALHPLDWRRFYEFCRRCPHRGKYLEGDLIQELIVGGFEEDMATRVAVIYFHIREFKERFPCK